MGYQDAQDSLETPVVEDLGVSRESWASLHSNRGQNTSAMYELLSSLEWRSAWKI